MRPPIHPVTPPLIHAPILLPQVNSLESQVESQQSNMVEKLEYQKLEVRIKEQDAKMQLEITMKIELEVTCYVVKGPLNYYVSFIG